MNRPLRTTIIVSLALALTACGGAAERKAKYMEKGQALYQQGNYDKAQVELRNVLQIDPKDIEARYLLGVVLEQQKNYQGAAGSYLAVLEQDSNFNKARIRLGRLYLLGSAPDRAMQMVDDALARAPENADVIAVRGGVRALRGDLDGALRDGERALALEPDHTDAVSLLAGVYTQKKQYTRAVELLDRGLAQNPTMSGLRALLAEVYAVQGKHAQAAEQLLTIVRAEPDQFGHRLRLAMYHSQNRQLDEAESVLREAMAHAPENAEPVLALVRFLDQERGRAIAQKELITLIEQRPTLFALRFELARLHEQGGEVEKARADYQAVIAKDGKGLHGLQARNQLARLWLHENNHERAMPLIREVLDKNAHDNDALMLRARIAIGKNDPAAAIVDLRAVTRDQPDSVEVLRLLAMAHARNREPALASDALKRAVEIDPRDGAIRLQLGQLLAPTDAAAALAQYREVLKREPGNPPALEAIFRVHAAKRDWVAAQATLAQLRKHQPDAALGYYLTGLLAQMRGEYAASVAPLEAALARAPDAGDALATLVRSYLAQQQTTQARDRLQKSIAAAPGNPVAHALLGEVYLIDRQAEPAMAALRKSIELAPRLAPSYRNLAAALLLKNDIAAAERVLVDGVRATGNDAALIGELAAFYQRIGRADDAIAQYEALLKQAPDSPVAMNNLAMLLVTHRSDRADLERARVLAERLQAGDNAAFLDTVGWVRYKHGEVTAAISALERALKYAPDEPLLRYHLGMAYYTQGDSGKAREHLGRAVNAKADFHGIDEAKSTLAKIVSGA